MNYMEKDKSEMGKLKHNLLKGTNMEKGNSEKGKLNRTIPKMKDLKRAVQEI